MAVNSSIVVSGSVSGLQLGGKTIGPITITGTNTDIAGGESLVLVLASGDNTITIPSTTCTAAVVDFPPTSAVVKKLKGVGGDTGLVVSKNGTLVLQFDSPAPTSFILNAASADTGTTSILFI